MLLFKKLVRFLKVTKLFVFDYVVPLKKKKSKTKTLLIVKTDAIGDYILFRNFLQNIRISKKYKDYHITLCGNNLWKDLAIQLDCNFVDEWIWLDRKLFTTNTTYRKNFLTSINNYSFETAINPTRSRYIEIDDAIISATKASFKIGRSGDLSNIPFIYQWLSKNIYDQLITESTSEIFEYLTNKHFIEQLLHVEILNKFPVIDIEKTSTQKYIVIIPGSGEKVKQWSPVNFIEICSHLNKKTHFEIYIVGSQPDSELANLIINKCPSITFINFCGKTTLIELTEILANAEFVFGNDTGPIHISAALKRPTLSLMNGIHFGRFGPYPQAADWIKYIYPEYIQKNLSLKFEEFKSLYKHNTPYSVNQITPSFVIDFIDRFLKL
ncbi:MAG: glycosyltransferase family 9 protein [Bacteroidetes bacterium]|nr:glycosyltransferase family 9 protein [Bacteroidota bacterium]